MNVVQMSRSKCVTAQGPGTTIYKLILALRTEAPNEKSHENQYNNLVMVSVIMGSCMDLYENFRCVHNHRLVAGEMQLFPFFFDSHYGSI